MQTMRAFGCLATVLIFVGTARGLSVRLQNADSNEPPLISYSVESSSPLEIVLELVNDSAVDSLPVVYWQLGLGVSANTTAIGDFQFESVSAPDGSLFGRNPGPLPLGELPGTEMTVSDADTSPEFAGVVIPADSASPIVVLTLSPTSNVGGTFTLWGAAFDSEDIDHSSYWSNVQDFESTTFDNPLSESQLIEILRITVADPLTLNGDYNGDRVVNAADYTVWRDGLDAGFDIEDYTVWKDHFGETLPGPAVAKTAPEPRSFWLMMLGLMAGMGSPRGIRHASLALCR